MYVKKKNNNNNYNIIIYYYSFYTFTPTSAHQGPPYRRARLRLFGVTKISRTPFFSSLCLPVANRQKKGPLFHRWFIFNALSRSSHLLLLLVDIPYTHTYVVLHCTYVRELLAGGHYYYYWSSGGSGNNEFIMITEDSSRREEGKE